MLRSLTVAVALVMLMPDAASVQDLPASPAISLEALQDTPRATTPPISVTAETQTPPAPPRPGQGPPPPTPPPPPAPVVVAPHMILGRDVNLQIELTISDQVGNAAPDKRVVSMLIADGAFGRIRSIADASIAVLNVDARPEILENDRIVVELT